MDPGFGAEISSRLLAFAEQTADFVGVADAWGRILYLNPAARKRLGVADLTGLTVADVFPPEAFAQYHEDVRPQLLRTGAWSGEVPVIVAGRDAVPMYLSTTAEIGPGGEINTTVVYGHEPSRVDTVAGTRARPWLTVSPRRWSRRRSRIGSAVCSPSPLATTTTRSYSRR